MEPTENKEYELTSIQKEFASLEMLRYFYVSVGVIFNVKPDPSLLVRTINTEIERNDGLRLRIFEKSGVYRQKLLDHDEISDIETTDLSHLSDAEARKSVSDSLSNRLDFEKGRPFIFLLFIMPGGRYCLTFSILHPYMDGYAAGLTISDTLSVYISLAGLSKMPEPLSRLDGYLSGIAEHEDSLLPLKEAIRKEIMDFCDQYGEPLYAPAAKLPKSVFDPDKSRYLHSKDLLPKHMAMYLTNEDSSFIQKERIFCEEKGIKENTLFLTALRSYYSAVNNGQKDIMFYTPNSARGSRFEKKLPIMLVTISLFRTVIDIQTPFIKALEKANQTYIHKLRSNETDESSIYLSYLNELNPSFILGDCIYYDLAFSRLTLPNRGNGIINFEPFWPNPSIVLDRQPIYLMIIDASNGSYGFNYRYRTDMYSEDDIRRLHNGMTHIIREGIKHPEKTLLELTDGMSGK